MLRRLLAVTCITAMCSFPVYAGQWKQDAKGWWYQNDNGSYKVNEWFNDSSNGSDYHFDTFGYMNTGKTYIDGKWYYFLDDGRLWCNYVSPEGFVTTNDGEIFYPDAPGILAGTAVLGNSENEKKYFVAFNVTNFSKYPLTVEGKACLLSADFKSDMYMFDLDKKEVVDQTVIKPSENKTLFFLTPDLRAVNYKLDEDQLRVGMQCNGADYYVYSIVYNNDTWNGNGVIKYCKP